MSPYLNTSMYHLPELPWVNTGWDEVKKMRLAGQDRIKSDQRILGESDFVMHVLSEADELRSKKRREDSERSRL